MEAYLSNGAAVLVSISVVFRRISVNECRLASGLRRISVD